VLSLSPSPLALGDVPKGTYGEPVTVTVTNLTTGPIVVDTRVVIQGTTLSKASHGLAERIDLTQSTCSSVTALAGGASCVYAMAFSANVLGALSGTLAIESSSGHVQGSVPFTANGSGVLSLSPSPLALGDVSFHQYGAPVTVTVTNLTAGPIVVDTRVVIQGTILSKASHGLAERIDLTQSTCSSVTALAGGASCDYAVAFAANKLGALSGTLAIESSSGHVQGSVPLKANGVQ
jgi:hypothetical protein